MRRSFALLAFAIFSFIVNAQQYPAEWVGYTRSGYLYDIQSDTNNKTLSETDFKNYLLGIAQTNLAKQIKVQVQDVASMKKLSEDGHTSISYSSRTSFSTDVNLKLVETKTHYDPNTKYGYAIAYINRNSALSYYRNEIMLIHNNILNAVSLSDMYIEEGFKQRAKSTLESSLNQFTQGEETLLWMNIFGADSSELNEWAERLNTNEQRVKQALAQLQFGTTIYLSCNSDLFGQRYTALENGLKGSLSSGSCNFTTDVTLADFIIKISTTSRESNIASIGGINAYFAYVDATICITKSSTMQVIYENEISVKGSHTRDFTEAAKSAYRDIQSRLAPIIQTNIKQ